MSKPSWLVRGVIGVAVLAAGAALRPERAEASAHGLWVNSQGEYMCGYDCGAGQKCCTIVILPAG